MGSLAFFLKSPSSPFAENEEECPYMKVAATTMVTPTKKVHPATGGESWSRSGEAAEHTTMDTEVAKPFRMLSAYFTTTATKRPPRDC